MSEFWVPAYSGDDPLIGLFATASTAARFALPLNYVVVVGSHLGLSNDTIGQAINHYVDRSRTLAKTARLN